jgi:hypothetical protein
MRDVVEQKPGRLARIVRGYGTLANVLPYAFRKSVPLRSFFDNVFSADPNDELPTLPGAASIAILK